MGLEELVEEITGTKIPDETRMDKELMMSIADYVDSNVLIRGVVGAGKNAQSLTLLYDKEDVANRAKLLISKSFPVYVVLVRAFVGPIKLVIFPNLRRST